MARDGWSVEQGFEKGRPPPEWWLALVDQSPEADWFVHAFWQLSSCRSYGMGYGPIPWTAIVMFAEAAELEPDFQPVFESVIREMDAAYLTWQARAQEERESARRASTPPRK